MILTTIKTQIDNLRTRDGLNKALTGFVIMMLVASPSMWGLVAFIDVLGLELLFFCLRAQITDNVLYVYKTYIFPFLNYIYLSIRRIDAVFYIPSASVLIKYPYLLLHAVPMHLCFIMTNEHHERH
jgi:hypothetical protein